MPGISGQGPFGPRIPKNQAHPEEITMTDASGRHCRRPQAPKPAPKSIAGAANCPDEAARGEKTGV